MELRCDKCDAINEITGVESLIAERDQLRAEVERLRGEAAKQFELWQRTTARAEAAEEQLEFDRTTCHNFITALDTALDGRFWLTEGRGSYSWDDDRYRTEFHDAAIALRAILNPMRKMAQNLSSRLPTTEAVVKARIDMKARAEQYRKNWLALQEATGEDCHLRALEVIRGLRAEVGRLRGHMELADHRATAATASAEAAEKELAEIRESLRSRHAAPLTGQTVADAVLVALASGDSHYDALRSRAEAAEKKLAELEMSPAEITAYAEWQEKDGPKCATFQPPTEGPREPTYTTTIREWRELKSRAEAADGRASSLYRALRDTVLASGGVAREGLSDAFLILGVPAEMAARKKAQEAAEAHAADLRRALEGLITAAECIRHWHDTGKNGEGMIVSSAKVRELWDETSNARAALARTPAQSLARVKAEALREAAGIIESTPPYEWAGTHREGWDHAALHLRHLAAEAGRREKEAANGR